METGVHNITIEQYHEGPGISRSGIMKFRQSPLHYHYEYLNADKPKREVPAIIRKSDALEFGNAFHAYVLEPQDFEKRYLLLAKVSLATKDGKKALADAELEANGRAILCQEACNDIIEMSHGIDRHATARAMIEGAVYEQSIFWVDKDTGVLCKVRPDAWHSNMIVDLKSARSADPREFSSEVYTRGYHIQAAMMQEAIKATSGVIMTNFMCVVTEKEAPYATVVYRLDDAAVAKGVEEFKQTLFEYKLCLEQDSWPAYPDSEIGLPAYAYKQIEGEI